MKRFADTSNDVIPICILGNYSAGKSSFINALIGNEILPSGDEPVTARIFRIERSMQKDFAKLFFKCNEKDICFTFTKDGMEMETELESNSLINKIIEEVNDIPKDDFTWRINKAIEIINSYKNNSIQIDDLINIQIDFINYQIKLNLDGLKVLNVDVNLDWAMLIAYFRGYMEGEEGTAIYERYAHMADGYDVVVGYIADDRMYQVLIQR